MNIQQTVINREVNAILGSGTKPVFFNWDITIHANNKDIKPLTVVNVEIDRDYLKKLTDKISVEVTILQGDLDRDIIPYKSNLEITLRKLPLRENVISQPDDNQAVKAFRYRATLYDGSSNEVKGNLPNTKDKETANRTNLQSVMFQLLHPVIEVLRTLTYGTTLRDMSPADAVTYIMSLPEHLTAGNNDKAINIKGVTTAANINTNVRNHIVIPHLTPVLKIPDYIHQHCGGLFSSGQGFYLQNNYWYVFSPFDLKAYDKAPKTLTIITVPANRVVSPERSYRETENQVLVLATSESQHYDISESLQLNQGNGVVYMDASKAFEEWGKVDGNKLTIERSDLMSQVLIQKRDSGVDFLRQSERKFTANPLYELSQMASRYGDVVQHTWENANPELLYPGMPVRNYYVSNNQAKELYGVLIGVQVLSTSDTVGMVNKKFTNRCVLTVFIERKLDGS